MSERPNVPRAKRLVQQRLASDICRFLSSGGCIREFGPGASGNPINDFEALRRRRSQRGEAR